MRNPFKLDCLKPKTKGDDDSLLRYPGPIDDKGGGFRGLGGGGTSSKWQTPPLGKGARHHSQAFQVAVAQPFAMSGNENPLD